MRCGVQRESVSIGFTYRCCCVQVLCWLGGEAGVNEGSQVLCVCVCVCVCVGGIACVCVCVYVWLLVTQVFIYLTCK